MRRRPLLILLAMSVLLGSCGGVGTGPAVSYARIGNPAGPNAALYFTVTNDGQPDRLIAASTEVASSVELHETTIGEDGTMAMEAVDGFDLPVNTPLVLEPGGNHLMLVDVEPMEIGDSVEITLTWENAGEMTIQAEVVDAAATMGDAG